MCNTSYLPNKSLIKYALVIGVFFGLHNLQLVVTVEGRNIMSCISNGTQIRFSFAFQFAGFAQLIILLLRKRICQFGAYFPCDDDDVCV